jgi:hypothetical protein
MFWWTSNNYVFLSLFYPRIVRTAVVVGSNPTLSIIINLVNNGIELSLFWQMSYKSNSNANVIFF